MALAIAARNADENRMIDAEDSLALTVCQCLTVAIVGTSIRLASEVESGDALG